MSTGRILWDYLKKNRFVIGGLLTFLAIFCTVFVLYGKPLEAVVYGLLLCLVLTVVLLAVGFVGYYKKIWQLSQLQKMLPELPREFPKSASVGEELYQKMMMELGQECQRQANEYAKHREELLDYYTLWVHQIKTPIAAMRLLMQSEGQSHVLLEMELFKIEQYVEMVLGYLRCESMSSDLSFREYKLDGLVRQAVRKYKKLFILQRITLEYEPLNVSVLTDEKWLVFVLEQLLSNALKYTPRGKITICMTESEAKTLVIRDTGIGIAPEDISRVFERGFTGRNGRRDKRSTGIGLYLVKKILDKLSHGIRIESCPGEGTAVYLKLERADLTQM